ncbi:unnamed protein product [Ectocarpus sp. 4 AP-2014]
MARQTRADAASSADKSSSGSSSRRRSPPAASTPDARGAAPSTSPPSRGPGTTELKTSSKQSTPTSQKLTTNSTMTFGILALTNDNIDQMNDFILRKMPGMFTNNLAQTIFFIRKICFHCVVVNGKQGVIREIFQGAFLTLKFSPMNPSISSKYHASASTSKWKRAVLSFTVTNFLPDCIAL